MAAITEQDIARAKQVLADARKAAKEAEAAARKARGEAEPSRGPNAAHELLDQFHTTLSALVATLPTDQQTRFELPLTLMRGAADSESTTQSNTFKGMLPILRAMTPKPPAATK